MQDQVNPRIVGGLLLVIVATAVLGVRLQKSAARNGAFADLANKTFGFDVGSANIATISCTDRKMTIDLSSPLAAGDAEQLAQSYAARFSKLRMEHLGKSAVTVVVLAEGKPVAEARTKEGESGSAAETKEPAE